jgi:hypothetical protein
MNYDLINTIAIMIIAGMMTIRVCSEKSVRNKNNILVYFALILSLVAFGASVFRCSFSCDRCLCNPADGIVVGAFGVIVTLLIGWNIYKAINIDKTIESQIKKSEDGLKIKIGSEINGMEDRIRIKLSNLYMHSIEEYIEEEDWNKVINGLCHSIKDILDITDTTLSKATSEMLIIIIAKVLGRLMKLQPEEFDSKKFTSLLEDIKRLGKLNSKAFDLYYEYKKRDDAEPMSNNK